MNESKQNSNERVKPFAGCKRYEIQPYPGVYRIQINPAGVPYIHFVPYSNNFHAGIV